jgi:alkylated DNA nucleotide flippase Atl1
MIQLLECYKALGGTEEELIVGMARVAREVAGDIAFIRIWREYQDEWYRLINGDGHATITGADIAHALGMPL